MWLTKLRPILGNGLHSRKILLKNHATFYKLAVFPPAIKSSQIRTYKNFGHRKDPPEHPLQKFVLFFFMGLVVVGFVDWGQ